MRRRVVNAETREFFDRHHVTVARDLVGRTLVWDQVGGMIVETEAYGAIDDPARHTASRSSARGFFESNPPGTVYVYINYQGCWGYPRGRRNP
jgi:DNA-3-methyladenine glycosylase